MSIGGKSRGFVLVVAFCACGALLASSPPSGPPDREPCIVECVNTEGEICGEQINNGCCCDPEIRFTDIAPGDAVCGTTWYNGSERDTDWLQFVLTEPMTLRAKGEAEFAGFIGMVETDPPGSGDCSEMTGIMNPWMQYEACEPFELVLDLGPGIWWLWVSPQWVTESYLCGEGPGSDNEWTYTFTLDYRGVCCLDEPPYCVEAWRSECAGTFLGPGSCGSPDCNGNGVNDACDLASGRSTDLNGNGTLDECDLLGDLNGDGQITAADLELVAGCMTGPCPLAACDPPLYVEPLCGLADAAADGDVDLADFASMQLMRGA
ncbi:MAG: hypothetical protein PVJ57_10270 [Phycisphaerae bacterium]|jgi:hypothetical protein